MLHSRFRGRGKALAGIASLALVLSACGGGGGDDTGTGDNGANGECAAYESYLGNEGTTVTFYTSIVDIEADRFVNAWAEFEECTGITIEYEGSKEFEAQLPVRVEGGNAPDLAVFPQPGLLAAMVATGRMVPAAQQTTANVDEYYGEDWKGYGTVDGTFYAAPLGANVKSFVWYSPRMFSEAGYEIPQTFDELIALSDRIVSDGNAKPWCAGIGSGDATGWPATDWMEDMMLRLHGGDVYDRWVDNSLPFNSPEVQEALEAVGSILKNPDYVNAGIGDVQSIATTAFTDGGLPIIDGECYMHRQASFYANMLSEGGATIVGPDDTTTENGVSAFYFPDINGDRPVLGGGEFVGAFRDAPEVHAVAAYLASPEFSNAKAAEGNWFSPNRGLDLENVSDPINRLSAESLQEAGLFRFDASDLMPAAVGAGSFWREMTAWIGQNKANKAVLDAIEQSWP
jgi:alpha-glucoside transport system substrate-binding protein